MNKRSLASILLLALKGALIGAGAILPGVSGGVLCLALGIYRPMMALLAHPLREFKKQYRFFLPIVIGFAAGVLGLSRGVDFLFRASPTGAIWLFVGLIAGTMPGLWREAGKEGRTTKHLLAGAIAFFIAFNALAALSMAGSARVEPSAGIWLLCGALWAIGFIVPGMSPSSLFIFMGVYQPMAAGIANLSLTILIPMGVSLIAAVLLLSRAVSSLFRKYFPYAMHAALGVAVASALMIVPLDAKVSFTQVFVYEISFLLGFSTALWMEKLNEKTPLSDDEQ